MGFGDGERGHDRDGTYRYASGAVCVSAIFAILTMPLLALLYGLF